LQQKKKPADNYKNWRRVFELIHGLRDLHLLSVVAAENRRSCPRRRFRRRL
jgi:hypothetical protein